MNWNTNHLFCERVVWLAHHKIGYPVFTHRCYGLSGDAVVDCEAVDADVVVQADEN